MSPQAWARVKENFEAKDFLHGGFVRVAVRVMTLSGTRCGAPASA